MNIEDIARVAHEVNRAYCQALGDESQLPWLDAPVWQRDSAVDGVCFHKENPDASPSASHDNWLAEKERNGWRYGREKNAADKTHPCMMAFDALPAEQRAKDFLFRAVVRCLV